MRVLIGEEEYASWFALCDTLTEEYDGSVDFFCRNTMPLKGGNVLASLDDDDAVERSEPIQEVLHADRRWNKGFRR